MASTPRAAFRCVAGSADWGLKVGVRGLGSEKLKSEVISSHQLCGVDMLKWRCRVASPHHEMFDHGCSSALQLAGLFDSGV